MAVEEGTERSTLSKPQIVDVSTPHFDPPRPRARSADCAPRQAITDTLVSRRDMLAEYFSFCISADGRVETLPLLLQDYVPNLDRLPLFLMRLGPQVRPRARWPCLRFPFCVLRLWRADRVLFLLPFR